MIKKTFKLKYILLFAVLAFSLPALSQKKKKELKPFTKIELRGNLNVRLAYATPNTVVVDGDSTISLSEKNSGDVVVHQKWKKLIIESKNPARVAEVVIYSRNFSNITLSGKSNLNSASLISEKKLTLSNNGDGKIDLNLQVGKLIVHQNGQNTISLIGTVQNGDFQIKDKGDVVANKDFSIENANIKIDGRGNAYVIAPIKKLTATVTGIGNVYYSGRMPGLIKATLSGSGKLIYQD